MQRIVGIFAAAAGLALAGCVVESVKPVRPETPVASRPSEADPAAPRRADGPAGASGRARIAFTPLGLLEYDGQTLPLAAPGGAFIASQTGRPAEWSTLLAELDAPPAYSARGVVRAVAGGKLGAPAAIPPGLLLGRSADAEGFLVEGPREDGARWIGRIGWRNPSEVTWLVQENDAVNAFAIAPRPDWIIYSTRAKDSPFFSLVERRSGQERVLAAAADCSYVYPAISADRSIIGVVRRSARGTELVVLSAEPSAGPARMVDAMLLSPSPDAVVASSVFASIDACPPVIEAPADSPSARGLLLFHPAQRTCVMFDAVSARLLPMEQGTIAAALWRDASGNTGAIAAAAKSTVMLDLLAAPAPRFAIRSTVASRSLVPRGTPGAGEGVLMVGQPSGGGADTLLEAVIIRVE